MNIKNALALINKPVRSMHDYHWKVWKKLKPETVKVGFGHYASIILSIITCQKHRA